MKFILMKIFSVALMLLIGAEFLTGCQVGAAPVSSSTQTFQPPSSSALRSTTVESTSQTIIQTPTLPSQAPSTTAAPELTASATTSPTPITLQTRPTSALVASATNLPATQEKPAPTPAPQSTGASTYRFHLGWNWKPVEQDLLSRFVIANDGSIYITDTTGILYRLSSRGDILWRQQISFAGATPAALSPNGLQIYIIGKPNTLFALNTEADILWEFTLPQDASGGPITAPWGDIYAHWAGSGREGYTRISSSGREMPFHLEAMLDQPIPFDQWIFTPQGKILIQESSALKFYQPDGRLADSCAIPHELLAGGPIVDESGGYYTVSSRDELIAWDGACQERWRFAPETQEAAESSGAVAHPIVVRPDGIVIYTGAGNWLYALNGDGKLIWQTKVDEGIRFLTAGKRGDVFIYTLAGLLRAYDKKGEQIRMDELPILDTSTPLVMTADGGVAFVRFGELWVISLLADHSGT